jgi:hydroxypyruvate isomerase
MSYRQSFSWWCFQNRGVDDRRLLKEAAAIGYDAVELISDEKFAMANDEGLAISAHIGSDRALNNSSDHDAIRRDFDKSLSLAVKYGITNLIAFSGDRRTSQSERLAIDTTVEVLSKIAPLAREAGVTIALELLNSKVDHAGYQCDHTSWGIEVCNLVNSPSVKLLYDIYHMQIMEGDLIRTIEKFNPYFCHYHTAGVPGRGDLDAHQEINYPAVFEAIRSTGYTGYIGHEFIPKADIVNSLRAAFDLTVRTIN